jgi:hypothetical protein
MNYKNTLLVLGFVAFALPATMLGQATTASIIGTVTDRTGAVVPNVTVTATQVDTNFTRTAETNTSGNYVISLLPVGTYKVEVAATGFQKFEQTGIVLDLNRTARVDPTLDLGSTTQTISVVGDAPSVNTTNATIGRTVENAEIVTLPLVNRDVYSLLNLTAGVDQVQTENQLGNPTITTVVNGSASGTGSVNYYLDGGNNTSGLRNTGNPAPNPDSVQEFRVITNSYGAEFGRFAGGVIDVITKSGSNSLHGSAFEFLRNDKLNANAWNISNRPALRRNQFGGTLGGKIIADKLFFFGSYSGLRQRQVDLRNNAVVPTALERQGDFSQSVDQQGRPIVIRDPVANAAFPGNVIPANRLDPTVLNIFKAGWIPLPNRDRNFYEGAQAHPNDTDEYQGKVDYNLTMHQMSGSYYRTNGSDIEGFIGSGNIPWAHRAFTYTQQNFNAGDTWTISPNLLNQFRLTYVRNFGGRVPDPQIPISDFGSNFQVQGTPSLPQITVTGYFNAANAISGPVAGSNYYGLRDMVNWTKGVHTLKFGIESSLEKVVHDTLLNNYGTFSFDGSRTQNALADFMLGLPRTMNQDAPIVKINNSWYHGLFIQDDIRLHPRFTLNLGLRYDLQTPFTDPADRALTYVGGRVSTIVPSAPAGLLFPGDEGVTRGIIGTDKNNFAPRVGFAWDPTGSGKTSIRGAFGMFYGSISGNEWNLMADRQPFAVRQQFNDVQSLTNPYGNVQGGSPFPYSYSPSNPRFLANAAVTGISLDFVWPYTYQTNFTVQREIFKDLTVSAGYVGSLGRKYPFQRDVNNPLFTPTATTANVNTRRPILPGTLSNIYIVESNINTAYHGLQLTAERRFAQKFMFKGYYTFSKALDGVDLQQSNVQVNVQDHSNLSLDRGRTASDRRHNFVMSTIWDIDYFKDAPLPVRVLLDHWTISGIVTLRSGSPFTVTAGRDSNLDGNNTDRANLAGDPYLDADRSRDDVSNRWFNTAAFTLPGNGMNGTSGRNILDGPGIRNVDMGILRNFQIREGMILQFRSELSNAFNLVSLNNPGSTFGSAAFGTIRSARPMRQVQFGLRLAF